jgi:hypothetical protein
MPIPLQSDFDATQLRSFARKTKDGPQARRLLALAADKVLRQAQFQPFSLLLCSIAAIHTLLAASSRSRKARFSAASIWCRLKIIARLFVVLVLLDHFFDFAYVRFLHHGDPLLLGSGRRN